MRHIAPNAAANANVKETEYVKALLMIMMIVCRFMTMGRGENKKKKKKKAAAGGGSSSGGRSGCRATGRLLVRSPGLPPPPLPKCGGVPEQDTT